MKLHQNLLYDWSVEVVTKFRKLCQIDSNKNK